MSVLGTGVASAVAQTSLQARQVAQQRDKRNTQSAADASRLHDLLELHLRALEEGDEAGTLSELRIDEQVPDHPMPEQQTEEHDGQSVAPEPPEATADKTSAPSPYDGGDTTLYRHLDIQA